MVNKVKNRNYSFFEIYPIKYIKMFIVIIISFNLLLFSFWKYFFTEMNHVMVTTKEKCIKHNKYLEYYHYSNMVLEYKMGSKDPSNKLDTYYVNKKAFSLDETILKK